MKPLLRDAHGPLLRAIGRAVRGDDGEMPMMVVESLGCADWASATFVGQRHVLALRLSGAGAAAAADRLAATIGETEIALAGHIVADIAVVSSEAAGDGVCLVVEALTLVD